MREVFSSSSFLFFFRQLLVISGLRLPCNRFHRNCFSRCKLITRVQCAAFGALEERLVLPYLVNCDIEKIVLLLHDG